MRAQTYPFDWCDGKGRKGASGFAGFVAGSGRVTTVITLLLEGTPEIENYPSMTLPTLRSLRVPGPSIVGERIYLHHFQFMKETNSALSRNSVFQQPRTNYVPVFLEASIS